MKVSLDVRGFSCTSHRRIDRGDSDQIYRQLYRSSRVDSTRAPKASEKPFLIEPDVTMRFSVKSWVMSIQSPPCFDALAKQGRIDLRESSMSVVDSATSEIAQCTPKSIADYQKQLVSVQGQSLHSIGRRFQHFHAKEPLQVRTSLP